MTRHTAITTLVLIFAYFLALSDYQSQELPLELLTEPVQTAVPTPTLDESRRVSAIGTPTGTVVPEPPLLTAPDLHPTPTPTMDGAELTAQHKLRWCMGYLSLIERWWPDFQDLDIGMIVAVMAKESGCDPNMDDGLSVGLMAVTPFSWTTTRDNLFDPATNVYFGMRILAFTLRDQKKNPTHDWKLALGAYNCGWEKLAVDNCGSYGGLNYADDVIDYWLPRANAALDAWTLTNRDRADKRSVIEWLYAWRPAP